MFPAHVHATSLGVLSQHEVINQLLLLFVIIALGSILGQVKVKGFSLGPAAVLFAALILSAIDPTLSLPIIIGRLGLAIFAYLVGLASGPMFFSAVRTNGRMIALVVGSLFSAAAVAVVFGKWVLHLSMAYITGAFVGALNNAPALASATSAATNVPAGATKEQIAAAAQAGKEVTVGYGLTYLIGVIVIVLFASMAVRRGEKNPSALDLDTPPPLVHESVRVDKDGLPNLGFIVAGFHNQIVFSRTMRDGHVEVAVDDFVPQKDDVVTIIGPEAVVEQAVAMVGHKSGVHLALDRSELDFRRIAVTNSSVAGRPISELNLPGRFGAVATRVRRGNIDMLASDDLVLQLGDRVRVTATRTRMPEVAKFLGDSERETGEVNPVGFALGMTLGMLVGLISFPIAGQTFHVGDAVGPLIVGLILGRIQRTGPIVWSVPFPAAEALRNFGILTFLAFVGVQSGSVMVEAFKSDNWIKILILGLLIVGTSGVIQLLLGRGWLKSAGATLAGTLAGSETQPAVLAYSNERTSGDSRVALGYALVYPVAMVFKAVIAPIMVHLF